MDFAMLEKKLKNANGSVKSVTIRHLEPGLVHYEYLNDGKGATVLIQRPFLDRIRQSLVGKPIINRAHRDIDPNAYKNGDADGIIIRAYNDPGDGWDYVEALVWDPATLDNIERGYSASCQYAVNEWTDGGTYHNIAYEREALNGEYEHIAIVPQGRYEGVRILMNSKDKGGTMKLKFWKKDDKEKAQNAMEIESEKTVLEREGKEIPLEAALSAYEAQEKAVADAAALANEKPVLKETDTIEYKGKQVAVSVLTAAYEAQLKNESEASMKKAHEDGDHKDKDLENCPMCNKAKNEHDEKEEAKKKAEDAEKAKNAAMKADRIDEAGTRRRDPVDFAAPLSMEEKAEKGREMFGSKKKVAA
jgi:hypothetical protein